MKPESGPRVKGHSKSAGDPVAAAFVIRALGCLVVALLLLPLFTMLLLEKEPRDMITGMVTDSIMELDTDIIITFNDSTFFVGEQINFSDCGYATTGNDVTCTFSPPLDFFEGTWIPESEDVGSYIIEINATDGLIEATKTINLTIVEELTGNCEMDFDIHSDHRIMIYWDNEVEIDGEMVEYSNFSLSYKDYLINGTFDMEDATTIHDITDGQYFDNTANETKERYYKLSATDELGRTFECLDVFGKATSDLTTDFGRWNYLSSPFLRDDKSFFDFVDEAKNDLEFAFRYDHTEGGFDFHLFEDDFGNIDEVDFHECLLIRPYEKTRITTAGRIMREIETTLTGEFGRWNYFGWVAEDTDMEKAFDGYENVIEFLFIYDHDDGGFDFHLFEDDFGVIDSIPPTTCNLVRPYEGEHGTLYQYAIG